MKFLRLPEVLDRVGMSRSQVYRLIQKDQFPKPVKLSVRASAWPDIAIQNWQEGKLTPS